MESRNHISAFLACVLFLLPGTGLAGDYLMRVSIVVSAKEDLKNLITSYVTREFRSLSDVVIVEDNPDWKLSIVALESHLKSGQKTGVIVSTVVLEPLRFNAVLNLLELMFKDGIKDAATSLIKPILLDQYSFYDHLVMSGSEQDIQQICSQIVADFDGSYLEKKRAEYQQIKDYLSENSKKIDQDETPPEESKTSGDEINQSTPSVNPATRSIYQSTK